MEINNWKHIKLVRGNKAEAEAAEAARVAAQRVALQRASGLSEVLRAMRDSGKPCVCHNGFFDLAVRGCVGGCSGCNMCWQHLAWPTATKASPACWQGTQYGPHILVVAGVTSCWFLALPHCKPRLWSSVHNILGTAGCGNSLSTQSTSTCSINCNQQSFIV